MPRAADLTLILSTMPSEIRLIQGHVKNPRKGRVECFPLVAGTFGGRRVVTAVTGVGVTNGAMVAADILRRTDIGSLEAGNCADIAIWPAVDVFSSGCEDPVDALLLCYARQVDSLVIGGNVRIEGGSFTDLDLPMLIERHHRRAGEIHAALGE